MSHLAGNWHHDLPGERRTARARPADGRTRVSANNQTLRPHKGRDYTQRGGTNPAVTFDPYAASPGRATRASDCESTANNSTLKSTFPAAAAASEETSSQRALS